MIILIAYWDDFSNYDNSRIYKLLKKQICEDQHNPCAYCEIEFIENEIRVEHFKSKSGADVSVDNWHLDWFNLLCVCLGGEKLGNEYSLPANLSCDSHKAHYEEKKRIVDKNWLGKILFPLILPHRHELFAFDKTTGMILPNVSYCHDVSIDGKTNDSTIAIVSKTIEVFNLNCSRLNKARLKLLYEMNKSKNHAMEHNDNRLLWNLIRRWTSGEPKFFQTTRDILIRDCNICQKLLTGSG